MSREFEATNTWPCRLDIKKKKVAEGINSTVFRVDDYTLKVYRDGGSGGLMNFEKMQLYEEITHTISDLAKTENWTIKLPFPFGERHLEINRFFKVIKCDKCGYLEAWAPFIDGLRLDSLPFSFIHDDLIKLFCNLNYQIDRRLDIEGIFIAPVNVRTRNSTLVVTDLCYDVTELGRKP